MALGGGFPAQARGGGEIRIYFLWVPLNGFLQIKVRALTAGFWTLQREYR